jgi:nitrogen fixation NifU-like protein
MELNELYQDLILDHFKHPRRRRTLSESEVLVDEENPTCGDHIRLAARVEQGKIADVAFDGQGCAISMASASMMADRLAGMSVADARRLAADFIGMMRHEKAMTPEELGDLAALEGVREFPLRVKCATMAWHAAQKALDVLEKGGKSA